jgi:tetratricopeptide (TPR) repeat protein
MSFKVHTITALLLALALPALAQDWRGKGRFQGKVTDEDGKPIAGATLECRHAERGGGTTITTDEDGKWVLGGIVFGDWEIDITAEGYVPKNIVVPLPSEFARLKPVVVPLKKAGPPPEVMEAYEKAEGFYNEGRFAEARAEYEKLLALRPDLTTPIHQQIGFTYLQEQEYQKAIEYLEKVLAEDPTNAQIRAITAQAALEGGMLERGRELLDGLDESSIDNPDIFFNMGVNFLNAGITEEAIDFFSKAIALDGEHVDGYYRRGLGYLQLGKQAECKADMQKVVELSPDSAMGQMAQKAIESLP